MDQHKEAIFQFYIVDGRKVKELEVFVKQELGVEISRTSLLRKLSEWGYVKNLKRSEVVATLSKQDRQVASREGDIVNLSNRPVSLERVQRHADRAQLMRNSSTWVARRARLHSRNQSPPVMQYWKASEKLLFDVTTLVTGSFDHELWRSNGSDLIILSSPTQDFEKQCMHDFLGKISLGCAAADANDFDSAGTHWKAAFIMLEALILGHYHDIVPNLVQQLNELRRRNRQDLAEKLQEHISECSQSLLPQNDPRQAIFTGLGEIDICHMPAVQERIMQCFGQIFEQRLGRLSYASFVMTMDGARQRLLLNPWTQLDDCIPSLNYFDLHVGRSDRRSLDILGLRAEILTQRGQYAEVIPEAEALIERAELLMGDDWQRLYNLVRGWFFLGQAQYKIGRSDDAILSLTTMLCHEKEFSGKVDSYNIFVPERTIARKYLDRINQGTQLDSD